MRGVIHVQGDGMGEGGGGGVGASAMFNLIGGGEGRQPF